MRRALLVLVLVVSTFSASAQPPVPREGIEKFIKRIIQKLIVSVTSDTLSEPHP